jgi:Protein of unknown function (DUF3224)
MKRTARALRAQTCAAAFVVMAVAAALFAQPALATTPAEGSGTFTFAPTVTGTRTADGNTFLTLTATEVIAGSLTGTATVQFEEVIHQDGEANTNGIITCTCTIGGRAGIVQFRFEGSGAGTAASPLAGQFTAQNGSGGLADLRLTGTFSSSAPGAGTYTVRWHFDP